MNTLVGLVRRRPGVVAQRAALADVGDHREHLARHPVQPGDPVLGSAEHPDDAVRGGRASTAQGRGAGSGRITMPLLRPVTLITLLLGLVYTLKVVDIIWIMTTGHGHLPDAGHLVLRDGVRQGDLGGRSSTPRPRRWAASCWSSPWPSGCSTSPSSGGRRTDHAPRLVEDAPRARPDGDHALPGLLDGERLVHPARVHPQEPAVPVRLHRRPLPGRPARAAAVPRHEPGGRGRHRAAHAGDRRTGGVRPGQAPRARAAGCSASC